MSEEVRQKTVLPSRPSSSSPNPHPHGRVERRLTRPSAQRCPGPQGGFWSASRSQGKHRPKVAGAGPPEPRPPRSSSSSPIANPAPEQSISSGRGYRSSSGRRAARLRSPSRLPAPDAWGLPSELRLQHREASACTAYSSSAD